MRRLGSSLSCGAFRRAALAVVVIFLPAMPVSAATGGVIPFVFGAFGEQEVPPVETAATGGCLAVLDQPAAQLNLVCVHNVTNATMAHIHVGAPGVGGPVVFDLGDPSESPFSVSWPGMTDEDEANLLAGLLYVNIHSMAHPGGEVRGQIVSRTIDDFVFFPNEGQSVPPTGSEATGDCVGDLSDDTLTLSVTCSHDVFMPTAAHTHRGAVGETGPILFDFGDPTSPFGGVMTLGPQDIAELAAQHLYVNIHSGAFPGGEIRGQMLDEQIFADGFESGDTSAWTTTVP